MEEAVEPIMNNYHRLVGAVMIRVASSVNVKSPQTKQKVRKMIMYPLILLEKIFSGLFWIQCLYGGENILVVV